MLVNLAVNVHPDTLERSVSGVRLLNTDREYLCFIIITIVLEPWHSALSYVNPKFNINESI